MHSNSDSGTISVTCLGRGQRILNICRRAVEEAAAAERSIGTAAGSSSSTWTSSDQDLSCATKEKEKKEEVKPKVQPQIEMPQEIPFGNRDYVGVGRTKHSTEPVRPGGIEPEFVGELHYKAYQKRK